jgi:hypothetical protein
MKTLLVCCLAVLAVAASVPKPFKGQQKTYIYRFDTQVSSSLIGASPAEIQQAAATRLRADAVIQFTNERHFKMQLQNIRIGELNSELPKTRVQPLEHFERKEIPSELRQTLELPLAVSYVDGVVERINFDENDSTWAKNIKRAVLNMLQLNLKRNDIQGLKMKSSMPEDKDVQVFSIPEITLEGECEVTYSIQKNQRYGEDDERTQFNVSKSINFNKCERQADVTFGYQQNPAEQLRCLTCLRQQKSQEQDPEQRETIRFTHCQNECQPSKINEDNDVDRSTFAKIQLVGTQEKFAIKRTSMMSQYVVKAQNPASQNTLIQVVALSELTFKQHGENEQQKVGSFKQSSEAETLMYANQYDLKTKRFFMNGDEEYESKQISSPFEKIEKKEQKVAHAIQQIVRQWSESDKPTGYELDAALNFQKIVEVIRQSSVKEIKVIEQVMQQVAQKEQEQVHAEKLAKTLFQDACAAAATLNSLKVLAQKIQQREIPTAKAAQLLKTFTVNMHSPSYRQAEILKEIAKSDAAQSCPVLRQKAWLSYGQLVGAICQNKPAQGQKALFRVEETCPQGKKDQFKQTLMQQWEKAQSSSIYDQIIALKTIGNAALDNTVHELQKIVKNKQMPTLVRMEAIDAMRRLRTGVPQKIQQALLPIFQNQRELPEVRMAAFSMIMYTHPEKSILDQLTFTTVNDRSQNVKTFVLTTMEALSKSPSSAEQEVANHMKAALKMVRMNPEQLRSSRRYRVPVYVSTQENTEEQNIFVSLASIVSPTNMLPIHLTSSLRSALNGEATEENLQVSMSQKNLEQWYERINEFTQKYFNSNNEEKESMERQSAKDLRQIYSSLGIKNRRQGSYYLESNEDSEETDSLSKKIGDNQPFGMICIRTNDVDQVIVPIEEQKLPHIIQKLLKGEKPSFASYVDEISQRLAGGQHFSQHLGMTFAEKQTKIPTTSGLPLALTRHAVALGSIKGELKVQLQSDNLDSQRGLNAYLKFRASGIASHVHEARIWSPVVISGVRTVRTVELNGPLAIKLTANKNKQELKVHLPEQERVRVLAIHSLPVTFTRGFEMQTRKVGEARVKTVHNWALEHTQQESQFDQHAFQVQGHYHHVTSPKQVLQALYTTENNVHLWFKPSERTPKELTLRLILSDVFQKHNGHSRPEMDSFYSSSKSFQHIYPEDFEGMELDQDEQRSQRLSTYSQSYNGQDSYKHKIRVEAEAHCGQKTHKVSAEFSGACDNRMKHCKIYVNAERSPLSTESQQWQMSAKIQTVMPEIVSDEENPSEKQSRMLIQADCQWGAEQTNTLNIRLQAEPTRKTYWQSRQQNSQQWSRFLNKIDLVAEYNLHSQQRHFVRRAYELLKASMFWQLSVQDRQQQSGSNGEQLIRATMVIDPITRQHANLSIQTPFERLRAEQVELPVSMTPQISLQRRPSNIRSFGSLISSVTNYGGAQCKVDDRRIKTFDGVSYRAPLSECWSVLAKDCSREQPRFAVLMKKQSEQEKKVKIILQDQTIELLSKQGQKPVVKIDGQQVQDEQELSQNGVELSYSAVYVRRSGLNVQFDGEEVKVQVSGQYKSQQCGLCGHYNDEEQDDFQMPGNQRSSSLKSFHQSYTLKNQECDESKLNKHYEENDSQEFQIERRQPKRRQQQQQSNWFESSSESNEERTNYSDEERWDQSRESRKQGPKPQLKTKVIEYQHKLCFSEKPVKRCPRGTQPDEDSQTEVNVKFFCLDRTSSEARSLQRQVRQGETVDAEGRKSSFNEQIAQPTKCVEAY